ncbi:hypothetical protein JVT61DRAFT_754 [Boletus reticuloceps]|uniref:Uncharacterized protein n=1 Tax=Boletus reticuloceps TaxID=495285 RepID=A0A8I3ADZ5_9AGAM|nr:hypothetical protein JVT61DRAFT_754 [Boletus reticuloceps]
MVPRRVPPSFNTLSPQDAAYSSSTPSSPANIAFPQARSSSPSGISQFLSKPSRWFGRKTSDPRAISVAPEPRSSTSSVRRPKISRPTDPRPILSSFQSEPHVMDATKSVAELALKPKKSLELNSAYPQQPSSDADGGLGDLRHISRKTWSKSADDLRSFPDPSHPSVDVSFQHRIQEYRNRSNSSATLHPASSTNDALPPSLTNTPPDDAPMYDPNISISISVSSPTSDGFVLPDDSPPTPNSRMHSFAPRLPTKLSASKLGLSPNSPKRKGSGDSMKPLDNDKSSGTSMGRGVFPFSLSGPSHKHSAPNLVAQASINQPSSSLLAPPASHDAPEADEGRVSRRTSQITYSSGFINRLTDAAPMIQAYQRPYSTAVNFTLAKGWKPFKAELKGSKLYFYKPPSDRSAAIKELFPTGVVPPSLENAAVEELEIPEEVGKAGRGREDGVGSIGRKKRAYWGRRTHPELVVSEGHIVKGTFEALVHEAVFATTFVVSVDENSDSVEHFSDGRRPEWKDFSSAVILCLPSLADRPRFENEFTRLCSNLVDGADDASKETERTRVIWMAQEYLRYYGTPTDESGWREFTSGAIPNVDLNPLSTNSGVPKSVSTQAIYTPSPNPNSGSPQMDAVVSPNLGAFSPRPPDSKMASLMEALGAPGVTPTSSGKPLNPRQQRSQLPFPDTVERPPRIWAMLAQDGFSREILSLLDPHLIASSLQTFHRCAFKDLPNNLTVEHVLGPDLSPGASDEADEAQTELPHSTKFFGSDDHPHWLTKLLLVQILGSDSSSTHSSHLDRTSRTHSRSEVISIWARVGELCRTAGDECSWKAISAALCSRPVARLMKVWRRADRQSVIAVESWIYPENDGHVATAREPMVTAWGGDANQQMRYELDRARNEVDEHWATEPLLNAKNIFESLRTRFALCSRMPIETDSASLDIAKLVAHWDGLSEGKGAQNAFYLKFQRYVPSIQGLGIDIDASASVDQFTSLSLAAEPRRRGLFEPFFWSQCTAPPHTQCHPLVPLLFVEPLPTVSLIDRGQVWRGRLESGPTKLSVEELQQLRNIDTSLRPFGKNDASTSKDKLLKIGDVDLGGTAIPVHDGELLLVARLDRDPGSASRPASRAPSRPPSSAIEPSGNDRTMVRSPSIRVKPGSSQGLERKSSVQRRNSLPAISQRTNHPVVTEVSTERPIRVLVQAGTLDRLVNVLIHGLKGVSVAVADDNGETSLRDGNTRDLVVDHCEFARVWWNVFRSFVTPIVFFELLRKRFVGSRPSSNTSTNAPIHVVQYRSEILGAMKEWITTGGGAQDCLDEVQLYETVRAFLEAPLDRSVPDCAPADDDAELAQAWDELEVTRKDTLSTFISHTLRPPALAVAVLRSAGTLPQIRSFGNQAPDLDRVTAEDLVENLNAMSYAAFSNVSEEDLFITADLLEVQSADRTGWFSGRDTSSLDDVDIQTMYSHLIEVEPSSMISDSQDSVYRLLPPSVRSCIRAYNILRKWVISKLVAPKLGIRTRQARMDLCLRAIEIARMRSLEEILTWPRPMSDPFPESRMHQRPWQNVANIRGVQCDSLSGLLSRPTVPKKSYGDPLIVDISWVLERILEIISIPNSVAISPEDPQSIINLDKRRHLCDVVLNMPALLIKRSVSREDVDRRDFERLNNIEKEMSVLHFDLRGIKEEAQREALQAQTAGSAKRDKNLYDRLSKDKKQEQLRMERRDEYLNKAMRPRKPMTQAQKQHRVKKSYSSAFFQLMRPISSAFTDHTLMKKSPAELDFTPSGKPSLVLSIVGAKVAQFINNERSYMFQLDTEEGEQYLLQAFSRHEMTKWIETITNVSKVAAKRRLTYLGNSPKPQLSDHIIDPVGAPSTSRDPTAAFGVELQFLLEREADGAEVPPGTVPSVIASCLFEVEVRGLSEVGIYRIAGASTEISALREAFNRGEMPITESSDIYAIGDLIKSWFRLLPEPVFPSPAYYAIIEAIKVENLHARLSSIRGVVHALPRANFDLLKRVAEHLDKVTDFEEQNHMTAEALAIVFSPNLLRAPQNDFALILANMAYTHKLVKALITHFHVIFDEDYEAENDVEEDDMEAPILEEEEEEEDIPPSQSTLTGDEE